jgi:uncharacterized protein YjdB/peptidoglycan/xylan/chitin deacetylase (PgdA/CDA1 family)
VRSGLVAGALVVLLGSCKDAIAPLIPTTVVPGVGSVTFTALGQTQVVSATILDQSGAPMTGVTQQWTSSADTVVTVTTGGVVTAVGNGTATLTATVGGATARIMASVSQIAASLSLSTATASFGALGDTLRLSAVVADGGGSPIAGASVAWVVLDTLVATVSPGGLVTAAGNGTTQLFAVSGAALAGAAVSVAQTSDAIMLSADTVNLAALGDTVGLSAVVSDPGGSLVSQPALAWSSSDTLVARVSVTGIVTSVANGTAVVTAMSGAAVGTTQVVVQQIAAALLLLPDSVVLKDPGDTIQLALSAWDSRGSSIVSPSVTWMSADGAVATVDATGLVKAVGTGTASITASVDGLVRQGSARVAPEVTLMAAGPTVLSGTVATQLSLSVRVEDLLGSAYGGATISWSTAAGSGAITSGQTTTSGPTGHSSAVWQLDTLSGPQQATASIESRGNVVQVAFSATAAAGPALSAALVADSILLSGRGETAFLGPTYTDQYGNITSPGGLTYESRDPLVATISPDGLVTAAGPGSTYMVLSVGSPTDSLLVTVSLRGAITITFDDGFIETYNNAFPELQSRGLRGNVGVNPAQVTYPAYMSVAQLDEVDAAGWSIVSHTMTHDTLTTLTPGELDWELRASQEWIDAQGYRGSNVFIVPFHIWGPTERAAIGSYYEATRGISATAIYPDTVLVPWRPSNPYDLTGIEADELPYTTPAGRTALQEILQRTVSEGAFIDVFFHKVLDLDVPAFRLTMDILNDPLFRDRVVPYHELYPRFARSVF